MQIADSSGPISEKGNVVPALLHGGITSPRVLLTAGAISTGVTAVNLVRSIRKMGLTIT